MTDEEKQRIDTLRAQLGHLNARARHYDDHAWKIPLSIAAFSGFVVFKFVELKFSMWWLVAPAVPMLFGLFHLVVEWNALFHTVNEIRKIEAILGLPQTWSNEPNRWKRLKRLLPHWH